MTDTKNAKSLSMENSTPNLSMSSLENNQEHYARGSNGRFCRSTIRRTMSATHRRKLGEANSKALKGRTLSEEHCRKIGESRRGIPRSDETRRKISKAHKGVPSPLKGKTGRAWTDEERLAHSERQKGRIPWNKGKSAPHGSLSEAHRRKISIALTGQPGHSQSFETRRKISIASKGRKRVGHPLSDEHKRKLTEARHRSRPSSLERFIRECLIQHGSVFIHQGQIPGFYELANRHHPWDFLLPDKNLAVELDGTYWHPVRPSRDFAWDCSREAEDELIANLLGWRVIRIPEKALRQSIPFRRWLKAYNREPKT